MSTTQHLVRAVLVSASLLASFCCVGCASQHDLQEKAVEKFTSIGELADENIADPERRNEVKVLVERALGVVEDFYEKFAASQKKVRDLYRDYDSTREEFEHLYGQFRAERIRHSKMIIDLALRARKSVTPEEWKAIHDGLAERMED